MVKSATKNVVFVSHASRDSEAANALVNHLLPSKDLHNGVAVRFTSAKQAESPSLLDTGTAIWKQLREDLEETKCFVACLSEDFFNSAWCIAELVVFQELLRKTPTNPDRYLALLVVDATARNIYEHFLVQPLLLVFSIWNQNHIDRLACSLFTWEVRKNILSASVRRQFHLEVRKILTLRSQAKKGYITEIAEQHLGYPSSTNGPITCLVRRDEYEQIAVNMARQAKSELLWTLFKSPLLVADAYRQQDLLMPYDKHFHEFDPLRKIRLVIFENKSMALAYANCNVAWHERRLKSLGAINFKITKKLLKTRKEMFEDSSTDRDGRLYFTTLAHLPVIFPASASRPPFDKHSYLEFAYADSENVPGHRLILESGFTSEFSRGNSIGQSHDKTVIQYRHVSFFVEPGKDCWESIQKMHAYKTLYGHIDDLRVIATTLFSNSDPDQNVFVSSGDIQKLCRTKP